MISLIFAAWLAAAAPAAAQTSMIQARQAYSNCLGSLLRADLKEKVAPDAFEAKLATACQPQADAFKRIIVAADVAAGISRASAEQGVAEEIGGLRDNASERYRDFFESKTAPR